MLGSLHFNLLFLSIDDGNFMNKDAWDEIIAGLPGAHILHTSEWASIKQSYGWKPHYKTWKDERGEVCAAAIILERTISISGVKFKILYIPRGPILKSWTDRLLFERVWTDLENFTRKERAIFIKADPEIVLGEGVQGREDFVEFEEGLSTLAAIKSRGWVFSTDQIQFKNTFWLDISGSEEELLASMKQKTRYNIRLAKRKGITVRKGDKADLLPLYRMYAETSVRDGFVIRPEQYYLDVWTLFMENGMATPLIAEFEGEAVAGLVLFHFARKSWYLHGMSRALHREKMPNYLLQWEAVLLAKQIGCSNYDLWGAPDVFDDSDSMWGVYRFKEGLGARVVRTTGAWDYTSRPFMYQLYTRVLPQILNITRNVRKQKTVEEVNRLE